MHQGILPGDGRCVSGATRKLCLWMHGGAYEVVRMPGCMKSRPLAGSNAASNLRLVLERKRQQRSVAGEFQLLADVAAMRLNCAVADEQFAADFLVGFVFGHQAENTPLGRGERGQAFL